MDLKCPLEEIHLYFGYKYDSILAHLEGDSTINKYVDFSLWNDFMLDIDICNIKFK